MNVMFDLVIQQARICDGTGNPSFVGSLGVTDGHITYLGRETGLAARRIVNADGLVVAPGFIDPHTHYDAQPAFREAFVEDVALRKRHQKSCSRHSRPTRARPFTRSPCSKGNAPWTRI
jgi:N-acyl-D-aspartate/D-glutamate deacylase